MYACPRQTPLHTVCDVNWQLDTTHKVNLYALGAAVIIIFLRSALLLKQNGKKQSQAAFYNKLYTLSVKPQPRPSLRASSTLQNKQKEEKNITTSAAREETSEPRSIFQCDKPLTHTRKWLLSETTKTKLFHPWAFGEGSLPREERGGAENPHPRGRREGGEAASPPPGRALPAGRAGDRAAAAAPPAAGRPLTPPRGSPRPPGGGRGVPAAAFPSPPSAPRPFLFA